MFLLNYFSSNHDVFFVPGTKTWSLNLLFLFAGNTLKYTQFIGSIIINTLNVLFYGTAAKQKVIEFEFTSFKKKNFINSKSDNINRPHGYMGIVYHQHQRRDSPKLSYGTQNNSIVVYKPVD